MERYGTGWRVGSHLFPFSCVDILNCDIVWCEMTEVEPTENQGWGNRQDGGGMLSVGGAGGEVRMKRSSTYLLSQLETQQKAKQQALQAVNQPNSEKISNIRKSVAVMSGPPETIGPQRRYSHRLSTVAGTNKRHSVEVRKSNLRLSAFDEVRQAPYNC